MNKIALIRARALCKLAAWKMPSAMGGDKSAIKPASPSISSKPPSSTALGSGMKNFGLNTFTAAKAITKNVAPSIKPTNQSRMFQLYQNRSAKPKAF